MTEGQDRNLDFAPTASIDKVALNNKIIKMRAIVQRAKLYVINDLTRKAKKLRSKKGSEDAKKKNNEKADRLIEEVKVIKILKKDYVSKYALGATEKFQDLIAKPTTSMEQRALARLSENKFIHEKVAEFRNEHTDWQELAAFLMTKQTSREFPKKKKAKENLKKVETNVNASETLIHAYLGGKLSSIRSELEDEEEITAENEVALAKKLDSETDQDEDEGNESNSEEEGEMSNEEKVTSDDEEYDVNEDRVGTVLGVSNDDEDDDDFEIPSVYAKQERSVEDSSDESSESDDETGAGKIQKVLTNLGDAIRLFAQQKKANKTLLEEEQPKPETKSRNTKNKSEKENLTGNTNISVGHDTGKEQTLLKSVNTEDISRDKKANNKNKTESEIGFKDIKTDKSMNNKKCNKDTSNRRDEVIKHLSSHYDDDGIDDDDKEEEDAVADEGDSDSDEEDEEVGDSDNGDTDDSDSDRESDQGNNVKLSNKKSVTPKPLPKEKTQGEMIIKRINLSKDLDTEEIPAILTNRQEKVARTGKKTVKDEFFACSDSEGNDDNEMVDEAKGNKDMEEDDQVGSEGTMLDLNAFSTTFVGSLSSEKLMECKEKQFRSNQEWQKLRHEKFSRGGQQSSRGHFGSRRRATFRDQSDLGRGRGRGGFVARGRGHTQEEGFSRDPRGRGWSARGGMQGESFGQDCGSHSGGRGSNRGHGPPGTSRPWQSGDRTESKVAEKLHPSWEASKKRKQQHNTIAAFEGKKIKFAD